MLNRFMPKEEDFFALLEQASTLVIQGSEQLQQLLEDYTDLPTKLHALENQEHACDRITHMTMDRLNKAFITPFDREDIHQLVSAIDDIMDTIEAAAQRMEMVRLKKPTEPIKKLSQIIHRQCLCVHQAVQGLRDIRNFNSIQDQCVEIHRLENESDILMKQAIGHLFDVEKDPIELMKMKEIYENLEVVTDRCEAVASTIQGVVVKMC
ncbi:MAG: DUF47 family protein [Verrucomicrobiae bacterium]|nr:DUF47 family protein [Verrucomicrobiae bacterium]